MLIFALNLILLGSLLYATLGRAFTPSGGVSIVLVNDLPTAMKEMSFSYPGGTLDLPLLDINKSVGHPIPVTGQFDATLSYKDVDGNPIKQVISIKPLGELLIVIHVLPELEETVVKSPEGKEEKLYKASAAKVRIIKTYQGENFNI